MAKSRSAREDDVRLAYELSGDHSVAAKKSRRSVDPAECDMPARECKGGGQARMRTVAEGLLRLASG